MTIQDIEQNHNFNVSPLDEKTIIKVVGVGGGGNNAINHMYEQGIKGVSFVVCNTDRQALNYSPVPMKLLIGPTTTKGGGAGNVPELARAAAEESAEDIKALFDDDTRMVFVTAGMGGGTGTGAAPVVAKIARELGLLTIGIVTIPFLFEGNKKILKALDGAAEMGKYVDALLVINNDRLTEIYPDLNFLNAFGKADDTLATAARSISEIITSVGRINLDFNDVNTTLRNGGAAIISSGYGEGKNRVTKAIEDALNSPLLKNRDIFGSKKLLFNIYFNPDAEDEFLMQEAQELTEFMNKIDTGVDVIWGVSLDKSLGNKVKITILAAGFAANISDTVISPADTKKAPAPIAAEAPVEQDATTRLGREYGQDKIDEMIKKKNRQRQIILKPSQMDDDEIVEAFEKTPAYNRDRKVADEVKSAAEKPAEKAPEKPVEKPADNNTPTAGHDIDTKHNVIDFSAE